MINFEYNTIKAPLPKTYNGIFKGANNLICGFSFL